MASEMRAGDHAICNTPDCLMLVRWLEAYDPRVFTTDEARERRGKWEFPYEVVRRAHAHTSQLWEIHLANQRITRDQVESFERARELLTYAYIHRLPIEGSW